MKYMLNSMCKNYANERKPLAKLWLVLMTAMSFTPSFAAPDPTEELDLKLTIDGWTFGDDPNAPTLTGYEGEGTETYKYYTDAACTNETTTDNGAKVAGGVPSYAGKYYVTVDVESGSDTASFTIAKADVRLSTPSVNTGLKYTGTAQKLIDSMIVSGGSIKYKVNDGAFDALVPRAINAGDYTIAFEFTPDANHNAATLEPVIASIAKSDVTLSTPSVNTGLKYTGAAQKLIDSMIVSGGSLKYKVNDGVFDALVPRAINAGNYTIAFEFTPDANHNDTTIESVIASIAKAEVSTKVSLTGWTFGEDAKSPSVSGNSSATYTYYTDEACKNVTSSSNGAETDGTVPANAGTYYVVASISESTNYLAGADTTSFTIAKADVSLSTPSVKTGLKYTGTAQKLIDSMIVSGGSLKYKVNDGEFDALVPRAINAGNYTIAFEFTPDANHNASTIESVIASIAKTAISPKVSLTGWTFGEDANSPSLSGNSSATYTYYTDAACKIATSSSNGAETNGTVPANAGTYYVVASIAESTNYLAGADTTSFTIAKANPSATLPKAISNLKESAEDLTLIDESATCTGGTLYYSLNNNLWSASLPKASEAGEYYIYFKIIGDANHKDSILTETVKATIYKELTPTLTQVGWTYGETAKTPTISGISEKESESVTYTYYTDEACTIKTTTTNGASAEGKVPSNAGTYYIKAEVKAVDFSLATSISTSFTIAKADIELPTINKKSDLIYNGIDQELIEGFVVEGGTVKFKVNNGTFSNNVPTGKAAGIYTIEFEITADNNHNNATIDPITVEIEKKALSLGVEIEGWTYGGNTNEPTISGNIGNGVETVKYYNNEDLTDPTTTANGANVEGGKPNKAGTYYVKAIVAETDNYKAGSAKTVLTIEQKEIGVKWGNNKFTYTGDNQYPTATPTDTIYTDDIKLIVEGGKINAGENYEAKVTSITGADGANYKLSGDFVKSFSIAKAKVANIVAPTSNTLTYNATNQKLLSITNASVTGGSFEFKYDGVEGANFTDSIPSAKNADTYHIEYRIKGDENHLDSTGSVIAVTIAQKVLEVSWGETEFTYDPEKSFAPSASVSGINGDNVSVNVIGKTSEPGKHEAKAELDGEDKNNYTITSDTKEFTIKDALINIPTFEKHEFTYTGKPITFGVKDPAYIVDGNLTGVEPAKYVVNITLNNGYAWANGTKTAIKDSFVIKKIVVEAPVADNRTFVYTGSELTYSVASDTAYSVKNNKKTNAGDYEVIVVLLDPLHYEWKNGTTDDIKFDFKIAKKVVDVPTVVENEFVYDGTIKNFDIAESNDYVIKGANASATNAGEYIRTVSLKDKVNYLWEDNTTADTSFTFIIKPQTLKVPNVAEKTFIYNGQKHTFNVPADTVKPARYIVKKQVESATNTGAYTDTLILADKVNYIWEGGSKENQLIVFTITDGTIKKPEITLSYIYDGNEITFVPEDNSYEVINGKATNAGTYRVQVTPSKGYTWVGGSKEAETYTVVISKATIAKPTINVKEFTYNGKDQDFKIPANKGYEITGITHAIEPETYSDTLTLNSNYMWNDESNDKVVLDFKINKIKVKDPIEDNSTFTYNGEIQEYKIIADSACVISGNKQKDAGTYTVKVSIDAAHYEWEINKVGDKSYSFVIAPASVNEPYAVTQTFTYDGTKKEFAITASDKCIINPKHASETEVGVYERLVSLSDSKNYVWAKGGKEDKNITFEIKPITIELPTIVKEYEYTGEPIVFVPDSVAYTVTNGVKTDAGTYEVTITPNNGYAWKGETTEEKKVTVVINPLYVEKPVITDTAFIYNGKEHDFGFSANKGYKFVGKTSAKEPGDYKVTVVLNKNYVWENDTYSDEVYNFVINKIEVAIPVADVNKFTYNGKEQTYIIKEDSTYTIDGNVQTNVGNYNVTVALKDPLHYEWTDSTTTDKTYDFSIAKLKVSNPSAVHSTTFIYDGKEKEFKIIENAYYVIADSNAVATKTGDYIRTVSLVDTANCSWTDGATDYKSIKFTIGDGTLQIPEVTLNHDYTGDTIVFIPNDGAYVVENGAKREVGTYNVTVTPNPGYRWSDSTKTTKKFTVTIHPIIVDKPVINTEYTYNNKKVIDFKIPLNEAYTISGETYGIELGTYKASLTLKPNYMWSDSTLAKVDYLISINKKIVTIPNADTTEYVFSGKRQTYVIAKSPDYQVINNLQTYAGTYEVTLILTDFLHTMWSDSTAELKTYPFEITKAKVELPKAVQETFVFDGGIKYFYVKENNNYDVKSTNATAIEVGEYDRTVSLRDTLNYIWEDGTTSPKIVTFIINDGSIATPEIEKEYTYTGEPFTLVPENSAYTVENGIQTNAGTYTVRVTLKSGYVWEDGTTEDKTFTVVIKPAKVKKPKIPTDNVFTYTGEAQGYEIVENKGYTVSGETKAVEPGVYEAKVSLNANYIWSDSTEVSISSMLTINKALVDIPEGIDSVFTYNGKVQTYAIPDTIVSYKVSGNHRTNAGEHIVSVALSDTLHYLWNDSTTDVKTYEFTIGREFVEIPEISTSSFVYDSKSKNFEIKFDKDLLDSIYVVKGPKSGINTGLYERIVSLTDTINYSWTDSTYADKKFQFMIVEKDIPIIEDMSFVYTGKTITFVPVDSSYSVSNGSAVDAGTYYVTVTPKTGYSWADGTFTAKLIQATIKPKEISKPIISKSTDFKYDGKSHKLPLQVGDTCILTGDTVAIEPGIYYATVTPNKNYVWKGGSEEEVVYKFRIIKLFVNIPAADKREFKFNNEEQEYKIAESSKYTVSGNFQTEEGKYKVIVELNDTAHYQWTDSTVANKTYDFVIKKNEFKINELTQLNDGSMDATPGGYAVLDLDIKNGNVYEYSISSSDCPALNDTFKTINPETNRIEFIIPDSVKPGIYEVTVTLKSGSVENKQTLKIAVNYPPSKIVVCWSNVLMVENKSGKFTKFQWYKDGEIIKGATSQYYQDKNGLNGTYHCEVNDGLLVGPAYFKKDMPLVLKARVENGEIVADVTGNTNADIVLMDINGKPVDRQPSGKNVRFNVNRTGIYMLNLEGTKQTVKVIVTE